MFCSHSTRLAKAFSLTAGSSNKAYQLPPSPQLVALRATDEKEKKRVHGEKKNPKGKISVIENYSCTSF